MTTGGRCLALPSLGVLRLAILEDLLDLAELLGRELVLTVPRLSIPLRLAVIRALAAILLGLIARGLCCVFPRLLGGPSVLQFLVVSRLGILLGFILSPCLGLVLGARVELLAILDLLVLELLLLLGVDRFTDLDELTSGL